MTTKTRYCTHYLDCDREENCFNGVYCPVFELNPSCLTLEGRTITSTQRHFEEIMDEIWEGQQKEE